MINPAVLVLRDYLLTAGVDPGKLNDTTSVLIDAWTAVVPVDRVTVAHRQALEVARSIRASPRNVYTGHRLPDEWWACAVGFLDKLYDRYPSLTKVGPGPLPLESVVLHPPNGDVPAGWQLMHHRVPSSGPALVREWP